MNIIDEGIRNKEKFIQEAGIDKKSLEEAIKLVLEKVDSKLEDFSYKFPFIGSENLVYSPVNNVYWTSSFWTGMLWLAYEVTNDKKYRDVAEIHLKSFKDRIDMKTNTDTQDLGFLYTLSCVAAYRLTGNLEAKEIALKAADCLLEKCNSNTEFYDVKEILNGTEEKKNSYLIIDCLMNLPLLYWAAEVTGDKKYKDKADKHVFEILKHNIRKEGSNFRSCCKDFYTGVALYGNANPGYSENSCWARGQAWAMYGLVINYTYTGNQILIELCKKLTNYFINRLPEDFISYWDLIFTDGDEERDSSAATIALCAMLELNKNLPITDEYRSIYGNVALNMLNSLMTNYTTADYPESNGVITHGVAHKPSEFLIDECTIFGDYFYFEALVRATRVWRRYW
jgi:unsaturated chondroitin disaccharide hydrolase